MLNKTISYFIISILLISNLDCVLANEGAVNLDKADIDRKDKASLQRGMKTFVNYCLGCHGAKYLRYKAVAKDLGMVDVKGQVFEGLIKKNLNFVSDNVNDNITSSMGSELAAKWFGKIPPDLSLIARVRGKDWLYTYLRSFYQDLSKPFGVNNLVFKDVGMPHVLLGKQGLMLPVYNELNGTKVISHLSPSDTMTPSALKEYDAMVLDLVNFLDYMGDPKKLERHHIGGWVLLFLGILLVFAYLLKREYWKDIH